jgi:hypothetical protein
VAYWELYADAPRNAIVEVTVRATEPRGLLNRIVGRLPAADLRVRWQEAIEPVDGVLPRGLDLDTERLPAGRYELSLHLTLDDGQVLRTASYFTVE